MAIFEDEKIEHALVAIWDFLSIYNEPVQADAIFAFGSSLVATAEHAAFLYNKGYAPVIVISGSSGPLSRFVFEGRSESEVFFEICVRAGVQEQAILIESRATHTGENIQFGMQALRDAGYDPKRLLAVSWPYHMRRVLASFKKAEPELFVVSCPPSGAIDTFSRISHERFALRLAGEIDRILTYGQKGIIIPQDVPPAIVEAAETIRRQIPPSAGVLMK